jgi:hypothetical protein
MKRKLITAPLTLGLALVPFFPASAGMKTLSEEELGSVSAQGIQFIDNPTDITGQENNNDSVQLNLDSQSGASGLDIRNVTASAVNIEQDIDAYVSVTSFSTTATSFQYADNIKDSEQYVTNGGDVTDQNNNNGSVQLNDLAQAGASAMSILNAADSAKNIYQRVTSVTTSSGVSSIAFNEQVAVNTGYQVQEIFNSGIVTGQNNNNSSVQVNDDAQAGASGMSMSNVAGSAQNIGQMVGTVTGSVDVTIGQSNLQTAINYEEDYQSIVNLDLVDPIQNNNNGSVQLNDNAQAGASGMLIDNKAVSAMNVAQNVLDVTGLVSLSATQSNEQYADNEVYAYQDIVNVEDTELQNNNNSAVQVNEDAQTGTATMALANTANSAMNIGQNVVNAVGIDGLNIISQSNYQEASNGALSFESPTQSVVNIDDAFLQDNNHASVQLNNSAQAGSDSMAIANTALSGMNIGQNVANLSGIVAVNIALQSNEQIASNYTYWSMDQDVETGDSLLQRNNLNSVQLNDDAQVDVDSMILANTAGSAMNIGQNVADSFAIFGFNGIVQENIQFADNSYFWSNWSFQDITNDDGFVTITSFQDNNNSSVQLNDSAQDGTSTMILANTAQSGMNIGQNVASAGNLVFGNLFIQSNDQVALNNTWVTQEPIGNYGLFAQVTIGQDNNNGSVQVEGAQVDPSGMVIANTANSAANIAQNIASGIDFAIVNIALQSNDQYAESLTTSTQTIDNEAIVISAPLFQDNNNGSVELAGGAQDAATGLVVANTAASAMNTGQNVASLFSIVNINAAIQSNDQTAFLFSEVDQEVNNLSLVLEVDFLQDNNNASVQLTGSQNGASAMSLSNVSNSAANVGQNVASLFDIVGLDIAVQSNTQSAVIDSGPEQDVTNAGTFFASISLFQDNNNSSVQLNGSQNGADGVSLLNASTSAVNVGQNIASVFNPIGLNFVEQSNDQFAFAEVEAEQTVLNDIAVVQDNNNGSVQLNDSQNGASGLSILNAAMSAVNVGQNIADITGAVPFGTTVSQANTQYAENDATMGQAITNVVVIGPQDNNNGSVQLNGSQAGISALLVGNVVSSAVNYGQNIASVTGASGITMTQVNSQTAINW